MNNIAARLDVQSRLTLLVRRMDYLVEERAKIDSEYTIIKQERDALVGLLDVYKAHPEDVVGDYV